jgi:lactoylglutathione lyase
MLTTPPHPHEPNVAVPPFRHYGLEHIGLTVDDVDAAVEELRAKGAEIAIVHRPAAPASGSHLFAGRKTS